MDDQELQKNIALAYSKLSSELQRFFADKIWIEKLEQIATKYNLREEQIKTLGVETTLVLLGIIHIVEYEKNLTNELNLPRESVDKILTEIENSFLKEVRGQLIEAFKKNEGATETDTSLNNSELEKSFEEIVKKSNYQTTLYNIAREYGLNVEQMGTLEKAVTNLINGVMYPDEFEDYLESNLGLPLEKVQKLVTDINEKIFSQIRESLKTKVQPVNQKNSPEKIKVAENSNTQILKRAGIEIMPEQIPASSAPTVNIFNTPKREEVLKAIEKPEPIIKNEIHPMFEQKMSKPFQIPMVKTEHSLDNLSKTQTPIEQTPRGNIIPVKKITDIKTPVPQAKDYSKTGDPYRLNPNE